MPVWVMLVILGVVLAALLVWASWGGKRRRAAEMARMFQQEENDTGDHPGSDLQAHDRPVMDGYGRHRALPPEVISRDDEGDDLAR